MPTLDWIGKNAVVNHHKEVPFHLLECDADLSVGDPESGNLLVQGDNLLALKALLPYYAGQVKCIYIDPPYNTGNEKWVYNDNVNSPEIRKWLGIAVGAEAEDLSRHDKWLCMMFPRLRLLKEFLKQDGVIFISIDDNEVNNLRLMLDEIFGPRNFMGMLVWKARQYLDSRSLTGISLDHEYIFVYSKNQNGTRLKGKKRDESKYKNPDNDPRGSWMSRSILGLANANDRPNLHYNLVDPATGNSYPCPPNTGWRYSRTTMAAKISENCILFPKKKTGRPREKVFLKRLQTKRTGFPSVIDGVYTADGSQAIREIFDEQIFAFPKAPELIQMLIDQIADKNSIIIDSFAGSGTTGQAVLALNKKDGGNRKCILVEMDKDICGKVTSTRLKRVIEGFVKKGPNGKTEDIPGLGGGFQYCILGETLFDSSGQIAKSVSFIDLARFVFFKETGQPLPDNISIKTPFIGTLNDTGVYLLYNGVLGDKTPRGGNALTRAVLDALPAYDGLKVVYGTSCRVGSTRLKQENIIFHQIPYELKVN